ncbi:MAG: pyridoxamine 5'-phosphate oxidase family protein [Paracoccus sp. (in: a-proteobacteria)]|uniref:pyridoxamine 5'-phosphate oxidase family protein n=1 Tax=Paracoccus sp. TaxID=267 RepID=UPI0026DFFB6C|nr:pyridoxamine 5'-phosphate oxidase family protein [Paracoccus sp. (in: a-proteobacteria)]MDO5631410.1 pyridoxamine 5'-phosphate oxidase family protein [Paracoccus sp. (in: a-proteobacteria)]
MTDHRDTFWNRLDDINAGMLGCDPDWRLVPMSHYADRDAGALWFITAAGTDLVEVVSTGARRAVYTIADGGGALFARIEGQLAASDDQAKLDEIWNAIAASWFEDGRQDNDIRLLRLDLSQAEVWATHGGLGFLFQIAKSRVTGDQPDMGAHFELTFP